MSAKMKHFLQRNYEDYKTDLFSAFIVRACSLGKSDCHTGFMTPFVWMFLTAYEKLRLRLISWATITTLVQLEYSGFDGATVPVCSFVFRNKCHKAYRAGYVRLTSFRGSENQSPRTLEAINNPRCGWFFSTGAENLKMIPGSTIAYWLAIEKVLLFPHHRQISEVRDPQVGLQTSDNARFVRFWWEICQANLCVGATSSKEAEESGKMWFPFNKGGDGRKWSANAVAVVNWKNDGSEIKQSIVQKYPYLKGNPDYVVKDRGYYFKPGVVGNKISSTEFSVAYTEPGFLFSNADMLIPTETIEQASVYCAF